MLSVEILADAVLTCGRTARLVSSQTNFNVDVYSAVTADFLKLPSRWDAWQMLFALMGERRGRFPHRRTSTLHSAFNIWKRSLSYYIGGIAGWCCSYL